MAQDQAVSGNSAQGHTEAQQRAHEIATCRDSIETILAMSSFCVSHGWPEYNDREPHIRGILELYTERLGTLAQQAALEALKRP